MSTSSGGQVQVVSPFPLTESAYRAMYEWSLPVWDRVADDFTPTDPVEFMRMQVLLDLRFNAKTWAIYLGAELGGYVRFEQAIMDGVIVQEWIGNVHVLFKKSFWRHKIIIPALTQVALEIFGMGIERVGMLMFADNKAIRSLASKMGAQHEGTLRKQTLRNGEYIDFAVYGLTRDELMKANLGHVKPTTQVA